MSRLTFLELPLAGLNLVERSRHGDSRGFLSRLFSFEELKPAGWNVPVAQINHTYTGKRGTVRGMHFQHPPHAEMKLVSCIRGKVWDVAVDLRAGSPTLLRWHGEELSGDNLKALLIPRGFAHGFQALTDDVELIYCHSAPYNPTSEAGLRPNDPQLDIEWPMEIGEMSVRDTSHPLMTRQFAGIEL